MMVQKQDTFFVIDLKNGSYITDLETRPDGSSRYASVGNPLLATRFAQDAVHDDNLLIKELKGTFPDIRFVAVLCLYSCHEMDPQPYSIATATKEEIFKRFKKSIKYREE